MPAAGELALAAFDRGLQAEEGNDVAVVGVEYLLVGGVRGCTNLADVNLSGEIFDVVQHDVGGLVIIDMVLAATDVGDVG